MVNEEKPDQNKPGDLIRDRAIRLFTYLRELTQLRSKVIRTLDNYDNVLWFSEIPHEKECFTPAWGIAREGAEEIWLEIKKPKLPPLPTVPDKLFPWVRESDLVDSSKDEPEILQRILAPAKEDDLHSEEKEASSSSSEPKFLELNDHLHILDIWADYLEKKWKPWAIEHRRLKRVQEVYAKLFTIYQKQKSLGEAFELVIGLGLLNWQTPTGQRVCRHLITYQAAITLDSNSGTLSVCPPAEGIKLSLEQDMLEASERPISEVQVRIEQQAKELDDDIWNIAGVEEVLRSWVQSVSAEGTYSGELVKPDKTTINPFVSYSPAFILRKRTERGLIRVYQEIIEQLNSGVEIPGGIVRTVEIVDDYHGNDRDTDISSCTDEFREIFFPLPANDEQLEIVENLNTRQGVLVQGPPGTGKSHTIVNLICHLLALGKRVLVTSQTPRALKVLKEKILKEEGSKEMAALCVSLLGNDSFALEDLEASVRGITDRYHNWNPHINIQRINTLRQELDKLRKRFENLNQKLREIKERETYMHNLFDGMYRGTAQQIAQQVVAGQTKHGWLQMRIALDEKPPLTNQEALELLRLYRELTPDRVNEIKKQIVSLEELPTPEEFVRKRDIEMHAITNHKAFADLTQTKLYGILKAVGAEKRGILRESLDKLLTAIASVPKHTQPWIGKAVDDILSNRERSWRELYNKSRDRLDGLLAEARIAEDRNLNLPVGCDRATLMADAKVLLDHLQKGGGFGIPGFRPKPVKSARYIIKEIRVDGRLCDNIDSLKALIATLSIDEHLDKLWSYWKPFVSRIEGSRLTQAGELEDICQQLEAALHLHELVENTKAACAAINGLPTLASHSVNEIEHYRALLDGILSKQDLEQARAVFKQADHAFRTALTNPDVHPVVREGLRALSERDESIYGVFYTKVLSLNTDRGRLTRRVELDSRLRKTAHTIADQLAEEFQMDFWDEILLHFTESWWWAQANTWLDEHIAGVSEAQLSQEIKDVQKQICITTGRLVTAMAWGHCLNRLKKSDHEHLIAWKQAMRRIGKGTGKRAEVYRREARENMEGCRDTIPAWIMPLYRVAETVKPAKDAYDVVIIDEASQSGPDALFLQFISKKIIVVGDDMQISPDSIGIPREDVDRLRDQYIRDLPLPHIGALGVEETSFFHLAEILFGGRIILREHFRCMPEIIQFSNDLCYQNTPLVPLRQYSPNRLKPVIAKHVADGYREGDTRTPRNPPEAQAIVDVIAECCLDPAYEGKTMGVISLLGEYQARLIEQKLLEAIGPEEIEHRNLICGDAYAFQGDERDIVFLSLIAAHGETEMYALTGQKHQRRFNVAASRARDQMWLFHTPTINDFRNKECLRYRLLSYCQNPKVQPTSIKGIDIEKLKYDALNVKRNEDNHPPPFGSWFEIDVFIKIIGRGYRTIPQFEVANYHIDFVVEGMRGRLAVECNGDKWHGPERYEYDMKRQRILERCGWTFWSVHGSEYYHSPDLAMESLWVLLNRLGIAPGGQDIGPNDNESKKADILSVKRLQDTALQQEEIKEMSGIHSDQTSINAQETSQNQLRLSDSHDGVDKYANREEKLEAILSIMPPEGPISRSKAIRVAAGLLKNKGRIEYQRVRKNGYVWNEFKSAITAGIRRGLLDGDADTIWRCTFK